MKIKVASQEYEETILSYNEMIKNYGVYESIDDESYKIIILDGLKLFATNGRLEPLDVEVWKKDKFRKSGPVFITVEN